MTDRPAPNPIDELAGELGVEWPAIRRASEKAKEVKSTLALGVSRLVAADDMSVVVFGSLARDEFTCGSDTDWTLLLDGQASSTHFDVNRQIRQTIDKLEKRRPGREGTFGGFAISHEILHRIGGEEDTNRNLTQRILLLLESEALGPREAHERVLRGVLHRYIAEDAGWESRTVSVPRFLLNDITRYWRTVAVDFAYKRRERAAEGWALRTIKLRLSRKLTYASGLLACFSCALNSSIAEADDRSQAVLNHLLMQVKQTPLERVASTVHSAKMFEPAAKLFGSYDRFLALLDDESSRSHLGRLSPEQAGKDPIYAEARSVGRDFQQALDGIFFAENGTRIPELTRTYGVF
jgi:predicted nucleotidyltransferase